MRITSLLFWSLILFANTRLKAQFIDSQFPKDTPQIFAPGIISNGLANRDMAISADWSEVYYSLQHNNGQLSTILTCREENGKWTSPEIVSFSGRYNDLEPAFSPDGMRLYFSSNRPLQGAGPAKDYDIWFVTRLKNGWSEPQNPGTPVNSSKDEFYPSLARSGNIYFTREIEGAKEDIVVCRFANSNYQEVASLSEAINTKGYEFNAFIDPDEKFILFSSYQRADDVGHGDLYASRQNEKGEWLPAKHLFINSIGLDYCPYVSPDGKYLFFTSNRTVLKPPFKEKQNYASLLSKFNAAGNGLDDIYWVELGRLLE